MSEAYIRWRKGVDQTGFVGTC